MHVSTGKAQIQVVAQNRSANHAYPQLTLKGQCRLTDPATIHRDSFQKKGVQRNQQAYCGQGVPLETTSEPHTSST